jgi:hypothetical protein
MSRMPETTTSPASDAIAIVSQPSPRPWLPNARSD